MLNIVISEFNKLRRYNILWIGIVAVFFSALLAAFQIGTTGSVMSYQLFFNNVIWNNFSLAFPFVIVLIGGFLIDREYTDNTLKSLLTVPISFRKILVGKLIVTGILAVLFAIFSFVCTLLLAIGVLHCENMTSILLGLSFVQIIEVGFLNFLAVAPLVAWFSRKRGSFFAGVAIAFFYGFCGIFVAGRNLTDFYPITAGLGIVRYTGQEGAIYNPLIGALVLLFMVILTMIFIAFAPTYDKVMAIPEKKSRNRNKRQHN